MEIICSMQYSIIFALDGVNTQSRESVLRVHAQYSTACTMLYVGVVKVKRNEIVGLV